MGTKVGSLFNRDISSWSLGDRGVHIYLPPSYGSEPDRRFPVLYLHDGQNVFSSAGTDAAMGWGSWELDLTVDSLCNEGKMQEIIMVAVDNGPTRLEEYNGLRHDPGSPSTPFENYEAFMVAELKPWVDGEYRTRPEASGTGVMGSSMGGLCSLALAWYDPEVFGGAASLSGAFSITRPNFLDDVLGGYHGTPKPFRAYLDSGVTNSMGFGGDDGRARTTEAVSQLQRIGWTQDSLLWYTDEVILTQKELGESGLRQSKWTEAQMNQHNEFYWRRRAWRPLTFLFPGPG